MAEESDSGSVHSTISDQSTDKKSNDQKRYYAFYTFYPNRPRSISDAASLEGGEQTEDGNLSLSIAATNLSASAETDLRKSVAQRLSRSASASGHGHFLSIGISSTDDVTSAAACYFCVLKECASQTATTTSGDGEEEEGEGTRRRQVRKFVVCFVSFCDSSLDLFRQDLDNYCDGLLALLDDEAYEDDGEDSWQLSQLNTGVRTYLEGWHHSVLEYLTRCITHVGSSNLQHLINCALVDADLHICGSGPEEEEDIRRFVGCCTLSPLLEQLQTSDQQAAGIASAGDSWQVPPGVVTLTLNPSGATFDMQGLEQSHFCQLAGDHLSSIDPRNVTKIRDSLESVKLAFIHNLNKLKRFLRQAELDHYALYRSYVFLRKSGVAPLLLRYVKLDASAETLSVLTALTAFMHSKGGNVA